MQIEGQIVVVTGGAHGIGRALCEAFHTEGATKVVVADLDETCAQEVAKAVGGVAYAVDVGLEVQLTNMINRVENTFGPIGIFCSNAGVALGFDPSGKNAAGADNDLWMRSWQVNVMAHVYAARTLLPRMVGRGGGHFVQTISAAGLLSQIGGAAYATTKHAAVGFAENLAITHREDGVGVTVLCPQGVDTRMLRDLPEGPQSSDGTLSPQEVATGAIEAVKQGQFLALPHPQVADYMKNKAEDYDRWIAGMSKLQKKYSSKGV